MTRKKVAYEAREVTYRCELTDADFDSLLRGDIPVQLLSDLLSLRIAMQQTAAENIARHDEKRAHRPAVDEGRLAQSGQSSEPKIENSRPSSTSTTLPRGVS